MVLSEEWERLGGERQVGSYVTRLTVIPGVEKCYMQDINQREGNINKSALFVLNIDEIFS